MSVLITTALTGAVQSPHVNIFTFSPENVALIKELNTTAWKLNANVPNFFRLQTYFPGQWYVWKKRTFHTFYVMERLADLVVARINEDDGVFSLLEPANVTHTTLGVSPELVEIEGRLLPGKYVTTLVIPLAAICAAVTSEPVTLIPKEEIPCCT